MPSERHLSSLRHNPRETDLTLGVTQSEASPLPRAVHARPCHSSLNRTDPSPARLEHPSEPGHSGCQLAAVNSSGGPRQSHSQSSSLLEAPSMRDGRRVVPAFPRLAREPVRCPIECRRARGARPRVTEGHSCRRTLGLCVSWRFTLRASACPRALGDRRLSRPSLHRSALGRAHAAQESPSERGLTRSCAGVTPRGPIFSSCAKSA